ncbi:MAG: hypothetical protein IK083_06170 [Abditibacteriota bacterium]|nr:hypothetical protein [Abditibacteriota bacterium]
MAIKTTSNVEELWDDLRNLLDMIIDNSGWAYKVFCAVMYTAFRYTEYMRSLPESEQKKQKYELLSSADRFIADEEIRIDPKLISELKRYLSDYWGIAQKICLTALEEKKKNIFPDSEMQMDLDCNVNEYIEFEEDSMGGLLEALFAAGILNIGEDASVIDCTDIRSDFLKAAVQHTKKLSTIMPDAGMEFVYKLLNDVRYRGCSVKLYDRVITELPPNKMPGFDALFFDYNEFRNNPDKYQKGDIPTAKLPAMLTDNGKGIIKVSPEWLSQCRGDRRTDREDLIRTGAVRAVVKLHNNYFVLLKKNHTGKIRFLNIPNCFTGEERAVLEENGLLIDELEKYPEIKRLIEDKIALVTESLKGKEAAIGRARDISLGEIERNDFRLITRDYMTPGTRILGSLINRIDCAVYFDEIADLVTSEDTGIFYLNTRGITDGVIDRDSVFRLREVPEEFKVKQVRKGDLLKIQKESWTKDEKSYFCAIADCIEEGETWVTSSDVTVYRITGKIDPWYLLKMIDESSVESDFHDIRIPAQVNAEGKPDPDKENEIGEKFHQRVEEYNQAIRDCKRLERQMKSDLWT